jgi:hypothetical protein
MNGFAVIHSQPGQLSLAIDKLKGNQDFARDVQAGFADIRGINRVVTDPDQGVLVVSYDKQQITSFMSLLALKSAFADLFPEVDSLQLAAWLSQSL